MTKQADLTGTWDALDRHRAATKSRSILSLLQEPDRMQRFTARLDDMLLDIAKTSMDTAALDLMLDLIAAADLPAKRAAMFAGKTINTTEGRAVLHTALRSHAADPLIVEGHDIRAPIAATLAAMSAFADGIRSGAIAPSGGGRFTDVVNIGIGGSDLGPAMATLALAPYHDGPRCHFVSNVDGAHIHDTLATLSPKTTLIIIASKTFTTIETMTNAQTALAWLLTALGDQAKDHLAAVSSALDKTAALGIAPDRVFGFADWVGGRYSLWGPVGLPIMLAIGPERFTEFLAGAAAMDDHFQTAPLDQNLPVLLAAAGLWHSNVCGYPTRAILPYDQRLARLPAYLQQLDMESNGKRVAQDGSALTRPSGPVVWGEPGTNGQHAFYQLLHQGTAVIPAEFLIAARGHEPELAHQHALLIANCLAQSEALMRGRSSEEAMAITAKMGLTGDEQKRQAAHRTFPGNRPSITLAYDRLTPHSLGKIIALYEHRVFVEGVVWGINSFDQWGVELGKELANTLLPILKGASPNDKDASTKGLIAALKRG